MRILPSLLFIISSILLLFIIPCRQLDTSPGKTFSSDDFAGGAKGGASGVNSGAGAGGMPKLQDLDLALGLGGPTTGPKKVLLLFSFCVEGVLVCIFSSICRQELVA